MSRRLAPIAALFLALALSLSGCAALHIGGKHVLAARPDTDPINPDLELAELVVDGQALGHIPVTIQFDEKRDYEVTFSIKDLGDKVYLLRNHREGAVFTIDMIGGQPAAIDDSTGAWEALVFASGGWNDAGTAPGDEGADEDRVASPVEAPGSQVEGGNAAAQPDPNDPFVPQIQLPIIVRLINGEVVEASHVGLCGGGTVSIVPLEGPALTVDALGVFTIESRTGQTFTSYVLEQGHSVP